mgnify:FL=1
MCFLSLSAKDGEGTTFIFLGGLVVTFGLLIVRRFCDEPEELLFLLEELRFFELLELELRELVAVEVVDFGFFLLTSEDDDDFLVVDFLVVNFLVELRFEAVLLRLRRWGV